MSPVALKRFPKMGGAVIDSQHIVVLKENNAFAPPATVHDTHNGIGLTAAPHNSFRHRAQAPPRFLPNQRRPLQPISNSSWAFETDVRISEGL